MFRASTYGAWHPLRIPRVSTATDLSRAMGWLGPDQYRNCPRAKPAALTLWHDPDYIAALQAAEAALEVDTETRTRFNIGTHSNPVFPEMYRRPATGAGGSLLAGELLAHGGVIYHPAGGTHHGMPDRANGFCYLNDPVLGMLSLRRSGVRRIAYIDIDAHHCDGVEHGFAGDMEALLVSVHEARRWPFTGALGDDGGGNCFNLPVARGLNDDEMAYIRDHLILPVVTAFRPDAVILQCGADAVEEDPLSRLSLSNNAHWAIVRALMGIAPRYLVLGGGGYNPWSVGRLWAGVWGTLNGYEVPIDIPDAARDVLGALTWAGSPKSRPVLPHMKTTLRDLPRNGAIRDDIRRDVATLGARDVP